MSRKVFVQFTGWLLRCRSALKKCRRSCEGSCRAWVSREKAIHVFGTAWGACTARCCEFGARRPAEIWVPSKRWRNCEICGLQAAGSLAMSLSCQSWKISFAFTFHRQRSWAISQSCRSSRLSKTFDFPTPRCRATSRSYRSWKNSGTLTLHRQRSWAISQSCRSSRLSNIFTFPTPRWWVMYRCYRTWLGSVTFPLHSLESMGISASSAACPTWWRPTCPAPRCLETWGTWSLIAAKSSGNCTLECQPRNCSSVFSTCLWKSVAARFETCPFCLWGYTSSNFWSWSSVAPSFAIPQCQHLRLFRVLYECLSPQKLLCTFWLWFNDC